eukprot:TRINITY_DN2326_c0_g1_i7.p1 TRINITY_DN2326_c0_g1~~TRINITY_DN2326_c0_g1_i7.p1  ORF type:complete len:420 (-),score=0.07 TRINITY_DN2326_c0_g1_i7:84-1343(-)
MGEAQAPVVLALAHLFWDEEDKELEVLVAGHVCRLFNEPSTVTDSWWRNVVPRLGEAEFRTRFRISRLVGTHLLRFLEEAEHAESAKSGQAEDAGRPREYSLALRMMATIYYLARSISLGDAGDLFGIPKTSMHRICKHIIHLITTYLTPKLLSFPTEDELVRLSTKMSERHPALHGAILATDGSHIPVKIPKGEPERYVNRYLRCLWVDFVFSKGWHSINCLFTCDGFGVFRHFFGSFPGSRNDAKLLSESSLPKLLLSVAPFFSLADAIFPLRSWLLVPFKGGLSAGQSLFNFQQSSGRIIIECSLGRWKGRFPRFRVPSPNGEKKFFLQMILTTLTLHNFITKSGLDDADDFLREFRSDTTKLVVDIMEGMDAVEGGDGVAGVDDENDEGVFDASYRDGGLRAGERMRDRILNQIA